MEQWLTFLLFVMAVITVFAQKIPHPTLPTMWISETNDPPMGHGIESYYFIDKPEKENPSAMWSNYTDCERLIYVDYAGSNARYLLKCDAVDCCTEDQEANQIEFQIPNVHPPVLAEKFKHTPNVSITTDFGETFVCDEWSWKFLIESWKIYTTPCDTCVNNVTLHRWGVTADGEPFDIDFKNFKGIPESQRSNFKSSFQIPKQCARANPCRDYRQNGMLRPRQYSAVERLQLWRKKQAKKRKL